MNQRIILILIATFGVEITLGCIVDATCYIEHSTRQIHCVDKQCMSFIGEKCIDGADCYNNIDRTSFGTECIQSTCRVSTGNGCNRNEECAVESDLCIDRKCTSTKCDCKSYENCVDYTCTAKACSITPDCDNGDGGILDSFCYDNSCRPLASFGGKCGISSDCGEADAACKDGICATLEEAQAKDEEAYAGGESKSESGGSSFASGLITGFVISGGLLALYSGYKTDCAGVCYQWVRSKVEYGEVPVVGQIVFDNESPIATDKEIQMT